ncbi:DUF1492 domain-containing protein [Streptococcus ruminantium]|nr:DUF1492 domain-containing protein [Streptococcus ruminantium]
MRKIKAKLKALSLVDSRIKSKRLEIVSLRSGILNSVQYTDEPKSGSQKNSSEELNARIIDRTEEIYQEIECIYDNRDRLVKAIDGLEDPLQSQILRLKYVNGYSWSRIKRELPMFSESTLFEYHSKGIQNLEKLTEFLE